MRNDFARYGRIAFLPFLMFLLLACTTTFADERHGDADEGARHAGALAADQVRGDFSVMVLGSGGPAADPSGRASAGYLIFIDGKPRILMDAGGGTFARLAESGVKIDTVDWVLLSHMHIDHMSDLSAMIKTMFFHALARGEQRTAPLHIYGPGANGVTFPNSDVTQYPATSTWADAHYAMPNGVERYLHVFAKAIKGGEFHYDVHDLSPDFKSRHQAQKVFEKDGIVVRSIPVHHGPAPAVAYRIEYKGKSLVFSGDTNSQTDNMQVIGSGADLLIYDTAVMDQSDNPVFLALHTPPTRLGQVAAAAKPRKLVLSHITPTTEPHLDKVQRLIRAQGYEGDIDVAHDLAVYNLDD